MLDRMVEKGAIFGGRMLARGGAKRYSRAPLVIGMYEAQVDRLTKELQQDFEQYAREGFATTLLGAKTKQMRTVPVNARFVPDRLVGRYDDARAMVEEGEGPWAARNCVCRQGQDLLGEPCKQTTARRVCLTIGGAARATVASGRRPGAHPRGDARPPGPGRARRHGPPARERAGPALHLLLLRLLLRDAAGGEAVPEAGGVPPVQLPGGGRRGGRARSAGPATTRCPMEALHVGGRRDRGGPRPLHRLRPVRAAPARATP